MVFELLIPVVTFGMPHFCGISVNASQVTTLLLWLYSIKQMQLYARQNIHLFDCTVHSSNVPSNHYTFSFSVTGFTHI